MSNRRAGCGENHRVAAEALLWRSASADRWAPYRARVRWDNLFDDLESQLEQGLDAEDVDLRAQEERLRVARLGIRDRLVALRRSHGRRDDYAVRIALTSGEIVSVRPATVGKDWLSGDIRDGSVTERQCIVPFSAMSGIVVDRDAVRASLEPIADEKSLAARLGFAFVLRDLARRRSAIEIGTLDGDHRGTIDRVGRDHLDLAVHEPGSPRREREIIAYRMVPLTRIVIVRV